MISASAISALNPWTPLPVGCPWSELNRRFPPNVKWCEETLCSWIAEPANTWSNVAYLLVGGWLLLLAARQGRRDMRAFGFTSLFVGVASFCYHASVNFPTQVLDFVGMYLFIALLLVRNLERLAGTAPGQRRDLYWAGVGICTALTLVFRYFAVPIQPIVGALILLILLTEWRLSVRPGDRTARGSFFLSLGLLAAASVCSVLDVSRTACNPQNHVLQGHAAWHVLSALSMMASYRFYRQFQRTP